MGTLTGSQLGVRLLAALRIDSKGVRRVTVDCLPDEAAIVSIERYVDGVEADAIAREVERYELIEAE